MEEKVFEQNIILESKIEELNNKLSESENKYLHLLADFDNYRKNKRKEEERNNKIKNKDLIIKLLDVIDNFERSFKFNDDLIPIYKQLLGILEKENVKEIPINIGDNFNETFMNAIALTPYSEELLPHNSISNILKKAYTYNEEIIRFAEVTVVQ